MDFQVIGNETLKIKNKKATLAVDPKEKISKLEADAILITESNYDLSRVDNYRVVIQGPGEFEVSGLKISGLNTDNGVIYELLSESTNVLLARTSALEKISSEKLDDYKIAVINADSDINLTVITAMEARVIVLYGKNKAEAAKKLGGKLVSAPSKISFSEEKLPEELEIVVLG